jgi:hypothetical protein
MISDVHTTLHWRLKMTNALNITAGDLNLFLAYAEDAGNWAGRPLVGGNVHQGMAENAHLTNLKKAGLVETFEDHGPTYRNRRGELVAQIDIFLDFTEAGVALAEAHGIYIEAY